MKKGTAIKTSQVNKVISDVKLLGKDLRAIGWRITPDTAGFYGELVAYLQIRKIFDRDGRKVHFGSGQSKADIQLSKGRRRINIEVKTSRRKEEWYGTGYGFALNIKKCIQHPGKSYQHPTRGKLQGDFCYFDYLVVVLLSDNLLKKDFYIFPRKFVEQQETHLRNRNKRFSSSTHRMIFIEDIKETGEITVFDRKFIKAKARYKNAWSSIN